MIFPLVFTVGPPYIHFCFKVVNHLTLSRRDLTIPERVSSKSLVFEHNV